MGNPKLKWTAEEEAALCAGIKKHGTGKWKIIVRDPEFAQSLASRTNIDLKDKWRNMNMNCNVVGRGLKNKLGELDISCITDAQPSNTPKPMVVASHVQREQAVAVVGDHSTISRGGKTSGTIVNGHSNYSKDGKTAGTPVSDSSKFSQDSKAARPPRYSPMFFEAISTLNDPNGSDVTEISNYIQKKFGVPPTIRRSIGTKLKRLYLKGDLEMVHQNRYKLKKDSEPEAKKDSVPEAKKDSEAGAKMDSVLGAGTPSPGKIKVSPCQMERFPSPVRDESLKTDTDDAICSVVISETQPTPQGNINQGNNNQGSNNYGTTPSSSLPPSSSLTPTTSPTSSPVPTTTPVTNTPSGSGKLGIAWAMGDDQRIQLILASKNVRIFHLWDVVIPDSVKNSGLPVSIMLWSNSQDRINNWLQYAKPGYATHAYGFNEVNEVTQANMAVGDAVSAWYSYIRPLADQGYTLGSPCTTSAPNGYDWVTQFFSQCGSDCHVDEVTVHWYDVHFADFQTYVENWANGFKKPVRITEFACQNFNGGDQPSMDDIWSFTSQAISWLDSYDQVLSYAPFGFMDDMYNVNPNDCLFTSGGLSSLGWAYVNNS